MEGSGKYKQLKKISIVYWHSLHSNSDFLFSCFFLSDSLEEFIIVWVFYLFYTLFTNPFQFSSSLKIKNVFRLKIEKSLPVTTQVFNFWSIWFFLSTPVLKNSRFMTNEYFLINILDWNR